MSLFENSDYRWRETCFVMVSATARPKIENIRSQLADRFEIGTAVANDDGEIVTLTIYSPNDFSAMDICFVDGEEVTEQMDDLLAELKQGTLDAVELGRLDDIAKCDARLDVLHFERVMEPADSEEEFLDPGSLLLVLEELAGICGGIGVDPQSGTIL